MHATRRHFKKCKALVGVDPLNKIAVESRMFPAGWLVLDKWLAVPQQYMATMTTSLSDTDEVPIC